VPNSMVIQLTPAKLTKHFFPISTTILLLLLHDTSCAGFYFLNFVRGVIVWQSSTRGLNQIWLQEESRKVLESCYILATCSNLLSKSGDFRFFLLTLEISLKSGKDSTSTMSFVIHRVRLKKKPCKKVH
jgi:hypothetical protein